MSEQSPNRQRCFARLTPVRAYRLDRGLTLFEVAAAAGLTTFRASVIERDPSQARPGEIEALENAADDLAARSRGEAT